MLAAVVPSIRICAGEHSKWPSLPLPGRPVGRRANTQAVRLDVGDDFRRAFGPGLQVAFECVAVVGGGAPDGPRSADHRVGHRASVDLVVRDRAVAGDLLLGIGAGGPSVSVDTAGLVGGDATLEGMSLAFGRARELPLSGLQPVRGRKRRNGQRQADRGQESGRNPWKRRKLAFLPNAGGSRMSRNVAAVGVRPFSC